MPNFFVVFLGVYYVVCVVLGYSFAILWFGSLLDPNNAQFKGNVCI